MGDPGRREAFHETPLVLFSALATAGAGVGATHLVAGFLGAGWALPDTRASILSGLLLLAAVASAGHLGRPARGPMALLGLGRSPLSNEVGALGLALVLAASTLVLPPGPWTPFLGFTASLASVFFLLALGGVYVLPGQVAWRGFGAMSPLVMGFTWGVLLDLGLPGGFPPPGGTMLWMAILADALLTGGRWRRMERWASRAQTAHPGAFRHRRVLMVIRMILATLATPVALRMGEWIPAVALFSLAILLDRLSFYALALRQTTESEVRRVESLLEG